MLFFHIQLTLQRDFVVLGNEVVYPDEKVIRLGSNQGIEHRLRIFRRGNTWDLVTRESALDCPESAAVFLPVAIVHVSDRNALVDRFFLALASVVVAVAALATVVASVAIVAHTHFFEVLNGPVHADVSLGSAVRFARNRDVHAAASARVKVLSARARTRDVWSGTTRTFF